MRIKRMGVSCELMRTLFQPGNIIPATKVIADGLPSDAVVCGVSLNGGTIWIDVQSESFQEVGEGQQIPVFSTMFETLHFQS